MLGSSAIRLEYLLPGHLYPVLAGLTWLLLSSAPPVDAAEDVFADLISHYLETDDPAQRATLMRQLEQVKRLEDVSKADFEDLQTALLAHQPEGLDLERQEGVFPPYPITVTLPGGRELLVLIQLPPDYDAQRLWPLLLAMHGGPGRGPEDGKRGAVNMRNAWQKAAGEAGWVVASPAMSHVFVHGRASPERLAYEILRTDQMEAVLAGVIRRFRIDPDKIVATGVSLGANFAIGYAAARPDRFAAIVPVSSEGEFRESLLINLAHTPVFAVSGGRDRNIRTIDGPRAMFRILAGFDYDVVYREEAERGHEGFQPLYPEILRWVATRSRDPYPSSVLRIPHEGIMPISRRVHWLEVDTRQGMASGKIEPGNRIVLMVRWARTVTLYLHDRLVDLDRPVRVVINEDTVFDGKLERSLRTGLEQVHALEDRGRPYATILRVEVPDTVSARDVAKVWSESLAAKSPGGPLSYWEHFAAGTLNERLPDLGFDGSPRSVNKDYVVIEVTAVEPGSPFHQAGLEVGDRVLEIDGEPFLPQRDLTHLKYWLERELTDTPSIYQVLVQRNDRRLTLEVPLSLEPF